MKEAYSELKIAHRQLLHENQEQSIEIRRLKEILTGISSQLQEFHISDDQGRLASDLTTAGDLFNTMTPNYQDAGANLNSFPITASSSMQPQVGSINSTDEAERMSSQPSATQRHWMIVPDNPAVSMAPYQGNLDHDQLGANFVFA